MRNIVLHTLCSRFKRPFVVTKANTGLTAGVQIQLDRIIKICTELVKTSV